MKKIISILLAFLILSSNLGISFAMHYCGGKVATQSVSLGYEFVSCGMPGMDASTHGQANLPSLKKTGCCENTYTRLKVSDNYKISSFDDLKIPVQTWVALIGFYISDFFNSDLIQFSFSEYAPPLLSADIPVLNQSFLI